MYASLHSRKGLRGLKKIFKVLLNVEAKRKSKVSPNLALSSQNLTRGGKPNLFLWSATRTKGQEATGRGPRGEENSSQETLSLCDTAHYISNDIPHKNKTNKQKN